VGALCSLRNTGTTLHFATTNVLWRLMYFSILAYALMYGYYYGVQCTSDFCNLVVFCSTHLCISTGTAFVVFFVGKLMNFRLTQFYFFGVVYSRVAFFVYLQVDHVFC